MSTKPRVFVITPFKDDFLSLYEELKRKFGDRYEFNNAGDLDSQQNILRDIVYGINNADVIIADLTGLNANVFYELGLAHAMNKNVIIITQDIGELPFDIKSYRANEYSLKFNKLPKLIETLDGLLEGATNGSIKYGNPVSDFVPTLIVTNQESIPIVVETQNGGTEDIEENKGVVDYIAEIQENANLMTLELNEMTQEMQDLQSSVESINQEMNFAKSKSVNTDVSFIRGICRKFAVPIEKLASQVNGHTQKIAYSWKIIENDYLSLLDNRYALADRNIQGLKKSLQELRFMQNSIKVSNAKMVMVVAILKNTLGLESKLNQAITALITEFEYYLRETETMHSSIDRILSKSSMVIQD